MASDVQSYNIGAIRELLLAAFTPQELRRLCQDQEVLRPIVAGLGVKEGLDEMVDHIIDYCETRLLFGELMVAIRRANPRQYSRFESELRAGPDKLGVPPEQAMSTAPWSRLTIPSEAKPERTIKIRMTLDIELPEFDDTQQKRLVANLASFAQVASELIHVVGMERGSTRLTIEVPESAAVKLYQAYNLNKAELAARLAPLVILDLQVIKEPTGEQVFTTEALRAHTDSHAHSPRASSMNTQPPKARSAHTSVFSQHLARYLGVLACIFLLILAGAVGFNFWPPLGLGLWALGLAWCIAVCLRKRWIKLDAVRPVVPKPAASKPSLPGLPLKRPGGAAVTHGRERQEPNRTDPDHQNTKVPRE